MNHDSPALIMVALLAYLIQMIVPPFLLVLTPKQSALRHLWVIVCAWIAYQCFSLLRVSSSGSMIRYTQVQTVILVEVIKTANLLLLTPLDKGDLVLHKVILPSDSLLVCVYASARLFFTSRGLKTPFQVRQIPPQPPFLTQGRKGNISRRWYLARQGFILLWQCLLQDIMYSLGARKALASKSNMTDKAGLDLPSRISMTLIAWFVVGRAIIDSTYRLFSLIAVALGDSPENWPPLFGSMWEAYTLRNFWGTFWHQVMRWPLTSFSCFFAGDILNIKHHKLAGRYVKILIVFLTSGFIHLITDAMQGVPPHQSGALGFFPGFTIGFMVEDGAQEIWRRISEMRSQGNSSASSSSSSPSSRAEVVGSSAPWKRVIGFIWVVVWLSLTSPSFLMPAQQLPKENRWFIPISLVDHIGLRSAGAVLLASGVIGGFAFGGVV